MWKKCAGIEKEIILSIHKKSKSISEIAKKLNKSIQIIGKTIERMHPQDLIVKTHDYKKDARKSEISINPKRIKIEKTHTFYLVYFVLAFIPFITSLILSFSLKNLFLLVGCSMGIIPPLLFILYQAYIKEDKVIVYKNLKTTKKEKKLEGEKKGDIVD